MVMAVEKQDCIVCLCEMSTRDEYRKLPNCDHGIQFHAQCIDAWLKDHSTCPICRSHIPRPLSQRLHVYFRQHLLQDVISYSTLDIPTQLDCDEDQKSPVSSQTPPSTRKIDF
ncbi:hypothetical protein L1987_47732 [Smallanthus sonchifolius]|uniref:Uncharacterized protein n=1 Tax=Smallanthus sonchifolius TaxID=185202 RepID=A0ACB9G313_9ASTR|nr:hypothetical protein L1987_47732 [Smallanthus sonchifolius]